MALTIFLFIHVTPFSFGKITHFGKYLLLLKSLSADWLNLEDIIPLIPLTVNIMRILKYIILLDFINNIASETYYAILVLTGLYL